MPVPSFVQFCSIPSTESGSETSLAKHLMIYSSRVWVETGETPKRQKHPKDPKATRDGDVVISLGLRTSYPAPETKINQGTAPRNVQFVQGPVAAVARATPLKR